MSKDAPPMTGQRARELMAKFELEGEFFRWPAYGDDPTHAQLDGEFTADELEAIAWWMRNKPTA